MESHVRIDEGIKRGPKPPLLAKTPTVAKRPFQNIPQERRNEIAHAVLARYMHGEQVAEIAKDFNTSDVTIYALLLRDHEQPWADAQRARALARLETSKEQLENAPDALSLARARELHRSAQWELERLLNRLYGQQQTAVNINASGPLQVQIVSYVTPPSQGQGQVIDSSTEAAVRQSVAREK